jgi:signal transduction histidine kinase
VGTAGSLSRRRAHDAHPLISDSLLVLLVTALALGTLVYRAIEGPEIPAGNVQVDIANALAIALVLAGISSLIWRRPDAVPVLLFGGLAFVGWEVFGTASPLLAFAPLIALYAVAANYPPVVSGPAAGVAAIAAFTVAVANPGPLDDDFLDYLLSVATVWLLGYGIRLNRVRTSLMADQATQLRREQEAKTQEAVRQEQTRIARELHDIVAHRVVVMVAQAGASGRLFDANPERGRNALCSIEALGREALTEMRRLLGVLSADDEMSKAPQPGLSELPTLVAQMEQAGLPVELTISGDGKTLPAGIELNAYRIVQEALTNTLKHAGPTRAKVELIFRPDVLELRVRDEGRGSSAPLTQGNGLVGMRQRVALLGGELTVKSRSAGGFQVTAELPMNGGQQ